MRKIDIIPSEKYKNSLKPLDKELLISYNLPSDILNFLTQIGLPVNTSFAFNENISITFCDFPSIKRYPDFQHDYLYFASMEEMGELSIDLQSKEVFQYVDECMPHRLVNSSIEKFIECLGMWLTFYPQLQEYMEEMYKKNSYFSLFENDTVLRPIRKGIKKVDPYCMKYENFFWTRMCEPDIF